MKRGFFWCGRQIPSNQTHLSDLAPPWALLFLCALPDSSVILGENVVGGQDERSRSGLVG